MLLRSCVQGILPSPLRAMSSTCLLQVALRTERIGFRFSRADRASVGPGHEDGSWRHFWDRHWAYGHRYSVRLCEDGNLPIRRRQSELGSEWAFNSTAFDSGRLLCLFGLNSVVQPFHKQGWQSQMLWNNLST